MTCSNQRHIESIRAISVRVCVHKKWAFLLRRVMLQLNEECHSGLEKYELLSQLAASNVTLLYYVLIHNIADLAPVVYTPIVGEACQKFDRIYRLSTPRPIAHLEDACVVCDPLMQLS